MPVEKVSDLSHPYTIRLVQAVERMLNLLHHVDMPKEPAEAVSDLLWALIAFKEWSRGTPDERSLVVSFPGSKADPQKSPVVQRDDLCQALRHAVRELDESSFVRMALISVADSLEDGS